ncbi:MAG: family N-acetyltransferase [Actinomycetia bacterium]|nr:family N-acetyltransferase [Actinomycetes bacterium]
MDPDTRVYRFGVEIRLMTPEDVPAAEQLRADAFYEADLRAAPRDRREPERRTAANALGWVRRTVRLLETDAGGHWVAADDSGLLGMVSSVVRERLWVLVTFAVRPGLRGKGIGRQLQSRAEAYGAGCERGILSASDDPLALRRYHAAGFALYPQMVFEGEVDRAAIPVVSGVREGTPDDQEWMDALDRDLRGASHGPDHATFADGRRLVVTAGRDGYAYTSGGGTYLLAARTEPTATRLLWECLAGADGHFEVSHVTSANMWAADTALRARLSMGTHGFLGVRGMTPPAPYIHCGPLL